MQLNTFVVFPSFLPTQTVKEGFITFSGKIKTSASVRERLGGGSESVLNFCVRDCLPSDVPLCVAQKVPIYVMKFSKVYGIIFLFFVFFFCLILIHYATAATSQQLKTYAIHFLHSVYL